MLNSFLILSRIIDATTNLQDESMLLEEAFDIMSKDFDSKKIILTLLSENKETLSIELAKGLSKKEKKLGYYKLGEGVIGKVAKTKKAIFIEDIQKDPLFLNKTGAYENISLAFICIPILIRNELLGTISLDLPNKNKELLNNFVQTLEIIAKLLAQAIYEIKRQKNLLEKQKRLVNELQEKFNLQKVIGNDLNAKKVYDKLEKIIDTPNSHILIYGEKGCGHDLVAQAIHFNSVNNNAPFIFVDIKANSFFHENLSKRLEKIELSPSSASICITNIQLLSKDDQDIVINLLKNQKLLTKARIILLYEKDEELDLIEEIRENFLYINLPPLINRKADIMMLTDKFLQESEKKHKKQVSRISTPAIDMITAYHWPGNLNELENCIDYAIGKCNGDIIYGYDLPASLQIGNKKEKKGNFTQLLDGYEKEILIDALKKAKGHLTKASQSLGISIRVLHYRLKRLNIDTKSFKAKNLMSL